MKEYLKNLIKKLGFIPEEGTKGIFIKTFTNHNNYNIRINFNDEQIEYGDKITIGDKTTSNFSNKENFVVLECVNRLLEKGYSPEKITLEIKWNLGRKEKGKLDIYVADKDDDTKCFLMIECKTFGEEYDKEKKNMLSNGGQLFSYFQQDKSAKYLCLYASKIINEEINYVNSIVEINEDIKNANSKNESHSIWNKSLKDNGIFEEWNEAYDFKSKALIREKLKPLQQSDSGFIFNRFAEILRHNVVSDKPNAFNKIFNLFLCKIEDEDRNPDEELSFQWKEDDTYITLQNRLNDLYKEGMKNFLNIDVVDFNNNDLDKELLNLSVPSKKHISEMFIKLRLYKNNEFAFKEVFDDTSFEENGIVIKAVVELLQPFQLRYSHKQQFLGDFFELLLNTGLKQESGQFFTPVPIAKFITSSIPFKNIIEQKLLNREENFLPYVIDYAAGSGHFLTESMDELQQIINKMDVKNHKPSVKKALDSYIANPYAWANEFIYGIEKDYRLVKTAKVACFLNGDGLANLIHADGLDSFENSKDYEKRLKITKDNKQNNHQFDVIVANPPYSVSSFKNTVKNGKESFDLFDRLTDNSSEIECLFIERTKQLLKEGAYAGIVLPSSILSNGGIYIDTRDLILKNFKIIAITEFGSNTFMATGTNTVVLFLKKRDEKEFISIEEIINQFIKNPKEDITCNGIENAFSKYYDYVYKDIENFEHYKNILIGGFDKNINTINSKTTSQFLQEYENLFRKTNEFKMLLKRKDFNDGYSEEERNIYIDNLLTFIKEREKEKLCHFMLSYNNQVVLVKSGEKDLEKEFLGYEFSNRRGHEGMKMYLDNNDKHTTKLYDMDNLNNPDKVNSYIYRAFLGEKIEESEISKDLKNHIFITNLNDMLSFDRIEFTREISLESKKKINIKSKWDFVKISSLCDIGRGRVINKKEIENNYGSYPVYSSQTSNNGIFGYINSYDFNGEYVTWTTDGIYAGTCFYRNGKFNCTNVCGTLKSKSNELNMEYLSLILNLIAPLHVVKVANPKLMNNVMADISIPLPPLNIQNKIINDFNENKIKQEKLSEELNSNIINEIFLKGSENSKPTKLENINTLLKRGKSTKYGKSNIQIIKSGQARGFFDFDFTEKHFVIESFISDERNLQKGDILINSTGVGTAGRITLFDLDGDFVVDSHITILRVNRDIAIPKYVLYALANIGFKNIEKMAKGQSGQIELSLSIINEIKINLPSLQDQEKIVNEIEEVENYHLNLKKEISILIDEENEILKKYL